MSAIESRELQRLRYRKGQTIRSLDFRDQRRIERQLRAWHNRALHNVYGVVKDILQGFSITPFADHVVVGTGLAYDSFGRELLLARERSVPFGDQREPMFLVLRRKEISGCASAMDNSGGCAGVGQSPFADTTELVWFPVRGFSFSNGVPIAKTKVDLAGVINDGFFVPRSARALSRPRIANGITIPRATTWLVSQTRTGLSIFQVQVKIDASSAGFTIVPEYFACLQGRLASLASNGAIQVFCLHFDHIEKASIDGFVFSFFVSVIKVVAGALNFETEVQKFLNQQSAYVSWVGIERNPGDPTLQQS